MKQYYIIYSKTLANKLCKLGYQLVETKIHDTKPWLYVYFFANSKELQEEVRKYREEVKKND